MKANIEAVRLKKVLLNDKIKTPERLNEVIKSDVGETLSGYLSGIDRMSVELNGGVDGGICVSISLRAEGVKNINLLPSD